MSSLSGGFSRLVKSATSTCRLTLAGCFPIERLHRSHQGAPSQDRKGAPACISGCLSRRGSARRRGRPCTLCLRGDRLAVHLVRGVSADKDAFHVRLLVPGSAFTMYPWSSRVMKSAKTSVLGLCPMATKNPVAGDGVLITAHVVADFHAFHSFGAEHLDGFGVEEDLDVLHVLHAVLHRLGRAHLVAAHEHGHLGASLAR